MKNIQLNHSNPWAWIGIFLNLKCSHLFMAYAHRIGALKESLFPVLISLLNLRNGHGFATAITISSAALSVNKLLESTGKLYPKFKPFKNFKKNPNGNRHFCVHGKTSDFVMGRSSQGLKPEGGTLISLGANIKKETTVNGLTDEQLRLHGMLQYFRAIGAWGMCEHLERILRGDV